jgi:hypothetical protein
MMYSRLLATCAVGMVCATHALEGQSFSQYRDFELGSDAALVSSLAGTNSSDVKTIHQRPALLQDLEWRPSPWTRGSTEPSTDPVYQIRFSFHNDQLFRIVVDYGADRTKGMTAPDMIEAIAAVYGPPLPRTSRAGRVPSRLETESGAVLALWGDSGHGVALYQSSSYGAAYRLIVTDLRVDGLARQAESQALRLDDQEAPAREAARQKRERDDVRAAAAKARITNKEVFRP